MPAFLPSSNRVAKPEQQSYSHQRRTQCEPLLTFLLLHILLLLLLLTRPPMLIVSGPLGRLVVANVFDFSSLSLLVIFLKLMQNMFKISEWLARPNRVVCVLGVSVVRE